MRLFDAVKSSVTVLEAAQCYGIAVRRGICRCPFHNDKTPSAKADERFHCFGCGADYSVIDFTANLFGLSAVEAAKKLASDFGIPYDDARDHRPSAEEISRRRAIQKQRENSKRLDELDDDQEQDFFFKYSGKEQQALLVQVASYVIGEPEHCFYCANPSGRRSKTKLCITCTRAQKLEIEFLFDFYKRLWEKEKKTILTAFCLKHELYPRKTSEVPEGEKPTPQEIERIRKAMQMLSDEQPLVAIAEIHQKGR